MSVGPKRASLKPGFDVPDEWQQLDLVNAHYHRIFGRERDVLRGYFERIIEEAIDP